MISRFINKNNIINGTFLAFILFPLLYTSYSLKDTFLDDSYITLTYSKNFFQEGKPWYNTIDAVQGNGQTSILWMLIESLFFNFKDISPVYLNKLVSFLLSLIIITSLFKSYKIQRSIHIKIFIIIFSIFYSYWSALNISHGLETVFYATVLLLFFTYRDNKISYFLVFILPFIRPESIIISFFFIIDTFIFSKEFFKRMICVTVSVLLYLLYTIHYYDIWLPLPFLLKNIREFSPEKIRNFVILILIFLPIILYTIKNYKTKTFFYLPLFFFIVYYSFFIDEVMNFFGRYQYPLFIYYIYFLTFENTNFTKNKILKYSLILASTLGIYYYYNYIREHHRTYESTYSKGLLNGPIYLGKYLKKRSETENKKLKIINSDAGAIAYYSNCYLYDTWGLNNATLLMARKDKNWHLYLSYLEKLSPDYIILISKESHTFVPRLDFEEKIYKHFLTSLKSPVIVRKFDNNYYYFLYKLHD